MVTSAQSGLPFVAIRSPGATLAQDLSAKLSDKFTDLTTDLEAFNTEPLV